MELLIDRVYQNENLLGRPVWSFVAVGELVALMGLFGTGTGMIPDDPGDSMLLAEWGGLEKLLLLLLLLLPCATLETKV